MEAGVERESLDAMRAVKLNVHLPEALGGGVKTMDLLQFSAIQSTLATYTAMEFSAQGEVGPVDLFTKDVEMALESIQKVAAEAQKKLVGAKIGGLGKARYKAYYRRIMETDPNFKAALNLYNIYLFRKYGITGITEEELTRRQLEGDMPMYLLGDPTAQIREALSGGVGGSDVQADIQQSDDYLKRKLGD